MASKRELEALIVLAGKIDPSLQKALKSAEKSTKDLGKESGLLGRVMSGTLAKGFDIARTAIVGGAAAIGAAMVAVGSRGIMLASDLAEVQNVVDVTFGAGSKQIDAWSQSALKAYGLSELSAKRYAGTMGAILKSSGLSSKSILEMSTGLTALAGDFASFYNLSHDEAFEKIRSGLTGETEPLMSLGINMQVASLQAYALSKGIKTAFDKMSESDKAILRYNYLMERSKDAQGDFTRTSSGFANQLRLLKTNFDQTSAKIMQSTLPAFSKLFQKGNQLMTAFGDDPKQIQKLSDSVANFVSVAISYLPAATDAAWKFGAIIIDVGKGAYQLATFISDNWNIIEPLILGIVSAMVVWKAVTIGMAIYQGVMTGIRLATMAAVWAQLALNSAIWANPMTWIIAAIVAAIAGLVYGFYQLYKHWDVVQGFLVGTWDAVKHGFTVGINFIVDKINWLIEKMNKIPGIDIPLIPTIGDSSGTAYVAEQTRGSIPMYANGGFANSPSIFGEAGPEAAIPLKRTPRSLSLLNQTAQALGVGPSAGGSPQFVFSPVINAGGGDTQSLQSTLAAAAEDFKAMCDAWWESKRRESFG